jgi:WD40 repeat protein
MKRPCRLAALVAAMITALSFATLSFATAAGATQQTGGSRLWATSYHGRLPGWAGATAEGVSPSGATLFVTGYAGYSDQLGSRQWVTLAYDTATGARLWRQAYEGTYVHRGALNGGTALAVSPDGSTVFVTGYSTNAGDVLENTIIAYSAATGATLWASSAAATPGAPVSLTLSPDGSTVYETTGDFRILAYSASTGDALWTSSASGLGSISEAHATAISPGGATLFVTGMSVSGSVGEYQTAAYDAATGATEWIAHYAKPNGRAGVVGASVAVSPDGSQVYVAGYVDEALKAGSAVLAYDSATGATLWTRYSPSSPTSVVASPNGSAVFVAGTRKAGDDGAVVYDTQALNPATGALLWSKAYGTSEREGDVTAMTMSPDGSTVFVTGQDQNLNDTYSFATVAYTAATGGALWSARYYGPNPTRGEVDPAAIAVSPDGSSVFVTGVAPNASPMNSLTTVAYGS